MTPQSFPWKQILPLSLTVMVAFGIMLYGFSVFLTDGAAGGEFTTGLLSIAYGGGLVAGGLLAYPVGRRADRRGIRAIFGLGAVLGAAGLTLFSYATEPWQVLVAWWLLIGPAGAMTFYEPAFIAVDRWCTKEQRARALAVLTLIGGLAGIIFLPGIERLINLLDWRPAVRVLGLLLLATGGSTALFFLRDEPPVQQLAGVRERFSVAVVIRDRRFLLFTAAMVFSSIGAQAVLSHRVARFEEVGFAVAGVALWAAVASALSLPGRSVAPFLAQRYPADRRPGDGDGTDGFGNSTDDRRLTGLASGRSLHHLRFGVWGGPSAAGDGDGRLVLGAGLWAHDGCAMGRRLARRSSGTGRRRATSRRHRRISHTNGSHHIAAGGSCHPGGGQREGPVPARDFLNFNTGGHAMRGSQSD